MLDNPNSSVSWLHKHRLLPEIDPTSSAKIPPLVAFPISSLLFIQRRKVKQVPSKQLA
jgi:hypothetical protein